MKLSDVWMSYAADRLGPKAETAKPVPISPWRGIELLFALHPLFLPRMDAITATAYDTAFDEEADGALCDLAMRDSFVGWEAMSAGAWRVMQERLIYAETVMAANEAARNPVISHLPEGLSEQELTRALALQFLLGGARTIDRRLLKTIPAGTIPDFPASTRLRRQ